VFDIGFSELLLVGIVALLVLGPERLPQAARTAGLWLGRFRANVQRFSADIDRELKAEELRQTLREEASRLTEPFQDLRKEVTATGADLGAVVNPPANGTANAGKASVDGN
jgi:sec-independent protein translocase protein TatB